MFTTGLPRLPALLTALLLASAVATLGVPEAAAASDPAPMRVWRAGEPLADVLRDLRRVGVPVSFSSILVDASMTVRSIPRGTEPETVLREILAPHELTVRQGPHGALLVVPIPRAPDPTAAPPAVAASQRLPTPSAPARVDSDARGPRAPRRMVAAMSEAIDVMSTNERPLLRPAATAVPRPRLEGQPSGRDPWSLLHLAPGVVAERVNVGGSETGQQARFAGPGTTSHENSFSVDGVIATDMTAVGTSSLYYDFDQLEEVRISSGGTDVRVAVAGVSVELITKRGADVARGSTRYLGSGQRGPLASFSGGGSGLRGSGQPGDRVEGVAEAGFEFGGPLAPGRLWGWFATSQSRVDASAIDGAADDTRLDHAAFKINAQLGPSRSAVLSGIASEKRKPSREAGPERAFEATWQQRGPTRITKLEATHLWGVDTVLTGQLSRVDGGFDLIANGGDGPTGGEALLDADGVWKNGYLSGPSDRASQRAELDGARYGTWRGLGHELRFGGSARRYRVEDNYVWPGSRQAYNMSCENLGSCGTPGGGDWVVFQRVGTPASDLEYQAAWLQDRVQTRRLTLDLGLRFDDQHGRNRAGRAEANPVVPDLLPAIDSDGTDGGFRWRTVSPRLGVAMTLGQGRSRVRASVGRFAEQLGAADVGRLDPIEEAEAIFRFDDRNGDNIWQAGEPRTLLVIDGADPLVPGSVLSPNRTDRRLRPELTDELAFGFERALGPNGTVALDLTLRRVSNVAEERLLVVAPNGVVRTARASDYRFDSWGETVLPNGARRRIPFFSLSESLRPSGGTLLISGDRERRYVGVSLRLVRRLADRWSMRGHVTHGQSDWRVPAGFDEFDDPTDVVGGGDNDGALHAERILGRDVGFLQSTWSASVEGRVQVAPKQPWGFNLAANLHTREGFPLPYFLGRRSGVDGLLREGQATTGVDEIRTDPVTVFDLRLEKEIALGRRAGTRGLRATLAVDLFNVFDERPVLRREPNLAIARANEPSASLAPRVARVGVWLRWR